MWPVVSGVLWLALPALAQNADSAAILERVAEEAAVFSHLARDVLSEETLVQRALVRQRRFRPRVGAAALGGPQYDQRTREIVSEYGYGLLEGALHEFRQVVRVDGRQVKSQQSARRTLLLGMRSADDAVKQRLLKDFEKHGLHGAAMDFGQLLLLFTARGQMNFQFRPGGERFAGAERVLVLEYEQIEGQEALTVFGSKEASRFRPSGELWVRASDYVPLRVTLRAPRLTPDLKVALTEASVEYAPTPHGVVLPAAAVHREIADGVVYLENQFRYTPFKRFRADSELKFEIVEPDPPQVK